jgi:hypothetical protein
MERSSPLKLSRPSTTFGNISIVTWLDGTELCAANVEPLGRTSDINGDIPLFIGSDSLCLQINCFCSRHRKPLTSPSILPERTTSFVHGARRSVNTQRFAQFTRSLLGHPIGETPGTVSRNNMRRSLQF